MNKLPVIITHSPIPFVLKGNLNTGINLLVISDNCLPTLRNAMPVNSAGESHGCLSSSWINSIRSKYNWAFSNALPMFEEEKYSELDNDNIDTLWFRSGSRLQFAWKSYSNSYWREEVHKLLNRQSTDLCEAIISNKGDEVIANLMSPILLACEGYSIY